MRTESAEIEAMKIFLGVLESDIIKMDVGLSDVDPRNLAAGESDEVTFVGELLCWLGKQSGILPSDCQSPARVREVDDEPEDVFGKARDNTVSSGLSNSRSNAMSPSTRSSLTDSANTALFSHSSRDSETTPMSASLDGARYTSPPTTPQPLHHDEELDEDDYPYSFDTRRPQCIHDLEDDTFVLQALQDATLDDPTEVLSEADLVEDSVSYAEEPSGMSGNSPAPVRYTGWLERVDADEEIASFEANRLNRSLNNIQRKSQSYHTLARSTSGRPSTTSNLLSRSTGSYSGPQSLLTRHNSPTQHTLALMNERAKLLSELANLKSATRSR